MPASLILYVVVADMSTREVIREYWMDYNNDNQRRVLGAQAKYCFEAKQAMLTCPVTGYDVTAEQCYGELRA
jgi:hypothetical protein